MVSSSELAVNPHFFLDPVASRVESANKLNVKPAQLKADMASSTEDKVSYKMLVAVVMLHMTGLVSILYAKPET